MAKFPKNGSLSDFQKLIQKIYGEPDDRMFSVSDILSHQERFTMRALKGIRKGDLKKLKFNLSIALSWIMALSNRFHIDLEDAVWERFPALCSYCGRAPCACRKIKPIKRHKFKKANSLKPGTMIGFQDMFAKIYPSDSRTLEQGGVHLAEEMGELSEAVHHFIGAHQNNVFEEIREEMADFVSCIFGVANSADLDISQNLAKMYKNNCHACHASPCICKFSFVSRFKS